MTAAPDFHRMWETLVARSILQLASAGPGDLVVELGAGTGEIGLHLSRSPIRYVGLDASAPMLEHVPRQGRR